jgi:hypothetical protein
VEDVQTPAGRKRMDKMTAKFSRSFSTDDERRKFIGQLDEVIELFASPAEKKLAA